LKNCRKKFIATVFCRFSCLKGRNFFLNLERFTESCEQYFRINFEQKFNFQAFNLQMIVAQKIEKYVSPSTQVSLPRSERKFTDLVLTDCVGGVLMGFYYWVKNRLREHHSTFFNGG
jgi:hypothetical protein